MARLPYVAPEELPEGDRDLVVSVLQDRPVNVYAAIANNPAVLSGLRAFLKSLWADSGLTERERELVILLAAAENGSRYEWHQHVRIAEGLVTPGEMAALVDGESERFEERERLLLEYARATLRHEVDDDLFERFTAAFDEATAVGAAALATAYAGLAGVLAALDVGIEDGDEFPGWHPGDEPTGDR